MRNKQEVVSLAPCPKCYSPVSEGQKLDLEKRQAVNKWKIGCFWNCKFMGPPASSFEEASRLWNSQRNKEIDPWT